MVSPFNHDSFMQIHQLMLIGFVIFFIITLVLSLSKQLEIRKNTKKALAFKESNPRAASVLLKPKAGWGGRHRIVIHDITNHEPYCETTFGRQTYWFNPGEYVLTVSYQITTTRHRAGHRDYPGNTHTREITYGPYKIGVRLEPGKAYELSFVNNTDFELTEI